MKVPVLLMIFNREDFAVKAMAAIREYRPDHIYISADGPRKEKANEDILCEQTRATILKMIDWPCKIKTLFRDQNLGCDIAVSSAISWFFDHEDFGVIIEDDIVVSQSFFKLCEFLYPRYRSCDTVMAINAQYVGSEKVIKNSYDFHTFFRPWGWATWKRAWGKMDMNMNVYPKLEPTKTIKRIGLFMGVMFHYYYWKHAYDNITKRNKVNPWDYMWILSIVANEGLVISPQYNLAINIGCTGVEGTHYSIDDRDLYSHLKINNINSPFTPPKNIKINKKIVLEENKDFFRIRLYGLMKILKKTISRIKYNKN